jgi:hypothetical protein
MAQTEVIPFRINQLSFSAPRWQHGPQICFANFVESKIIRLLIAQQPLKLEKNKNMLFAPNVKKVSLRGRLARQ